MTTKVKICGVKTLEDADCAIQSGADWIGFVFYEKSARYIAPQQLKDWFGQIKKSVQTVGVFVNPSKSWVEEVISCVALDILQFHGDESEHFSASFNQDYWKAIRVRSKEQVQKEAAHFTSAQALLLDAYNAHEWGGTGEHFDWTMIPELKKPFLLAGGLTPDNVCEAVKACKPYGVDVSSGVEASPAIKDHGKVKTFIEMAKGLQI